MARTFKMVNGDFVRDKANNLVTIDNLNLLKQHVHQAIIEATQIDDIAQLTVDELQDITSSILYARIFSALTTLESLLGIGDVSRTADEQIGSIDAVLAQRDPNDHRTFKFFVAVSSVGGGDIQLSGAIGGIE